MNVNASDKIIRMFLACLPAQIYAVVMVAIVLFDLYIGSMRHAVSNLIFLFAGVMFLWILCAAKMSYVAYSLLLLPVVFYLFLFAFIIYDQSLISLIREKVKHPKLLAVRVEKKNCGEGETCSSD